jgi:MATE family multidrug resistance protein
MQATLLVVNLGGFWGVGMVLGILLTFKAGVGVMGLWFGLLSGITATGAQISPSESAG